MRLRQHQESGYFQTKLSVWAEVVASSCFPHSAFILKENQSGERVFLLDLLT